eukprot:1061864-Amphidinium_carterae.1
MLKAFTTSTSKGKGLLQRTLCLYALHVFGTKVAVARTDSAHLDLEKALCVLKCQSCHSERVQNA